MHWAGGQTEAIQEQNLLEATEVEVHKTYLHNNKKHPPKKIIHPGPRNSSSGMEPTARAQ